MESGRLCELEALWRQCARTGFSERAIARKAIPRRKAIHPSEMDRLAVRAQLNVIQDYPPCGLDVRRESNDIEQGPRMTVIGIDEGQTKFFPCSDFTNKFRAAPGVHSHGGGKVGNQPRNLKTRRLHFLDDALPAEVDRFHQDFIPVSVLPINGRDDYCRGKAGQPSNLNSAARRENTINGREKKIILPTNSSRVPCAIELHHLAEKIQFPGRRSSVAVRYRSDDDAPASYFFRGLPFRGFGTARRCGHNRGLAHRFHLNAVAEISDGSLRKSQPWLPTHRGNNGLSRDPRCQGKG
jgi:hypothetical protein